MLPRQTLTFPLLVAVTFRYSSPPVGVDITLGNRFTAVLTETPSESALTYTYKGGSVEFSKSRDYDSPLPTIVHSLSYSSDGHWCPELNSRPLQNIKADT